MGWTSEQEHCIHSHGGTLLVSAAAGSGKTTVLVERIVQYVLGGHDIDRLLVVTFTNAAAAEMRQRLTVALTKQAAAQPDNLHLQHQLIRLPRADICTVDSFCINLVRENFYQVGVSPQFRIADEQQLLLLKREALDETLQQFYDEQDPDFLELATGMTDGKTDARLMSTVDTLFSFIQSYPDPERWLRDTAAMYDGTDTVSETVWGAYLLKKIRGALARCQRLYTAALSEALGDPVLVRAYSPSLKAELDQVTQLQQYAEQGRWDPLFEGIAAFSFVGFKSTAGCENTDARQRAKVLRDNAKALIGDLAALCCGTEQQCREDIRRGARLIRALYAVIRRFMAVFTEKKRAGNLLDFSDTEHLALSLLTEYNEQDKLVPTARAREIAERYDEIMVDEYQDTNAVQDALFAALSRDEQNLFLVGDVKQSIYAFRKAMPELFLSRRDAYPLFDGEHYPGTILLGHNFRSRRAVTDTVNFVFHQLMIPALGGIAYNDQEKLHYGATYPPVEDESVYDTECLILDGKEAKACGYSADEAEGRVIAERIKQLLANFSVTEKDGSRRPLQYKDCCILLRSHRTHAPAYCKALESYGIPTVAKLESNFFETPEVRLTVSLLRCIDNPLLDIPLVAVMLSPLFGFTTDELATIRLCRPKAALYMAVTAACRHADPLLAERCHHFLSTLDRYRQLSAVLTVDRLLTRLYEDLSLPELFSARFGGTTRAANLRVLYEQCCRFEQGGFRGLSAFIRHIDRLQEQGISLSATTPDTENAVRIMSVHGSKGLEFPVVFLAGLATGFSTEDTKKDLLLHAKYGAGMNHRDPVTFARRHTLPRNGLLLMQQDESRAEELRILYVAMTRAREKLYLVTTPSSPDDTLSALATGIRPACDTLSPETLGDAGCLSDWVLGALLRHPSCGELRERACVLEPITAEDASTVRVSFCAPPPVEDGASNGADETITAQPDGALVATLRERIAYRYPHDALSRVPTKLAASEIAADPTSPDLVAHARPSFLAKQGLTPAERGTAMHSFMQFADFAAAAASTKQEATRLETNGFLSAEQAASLDHKRLRAFFDSELYRRMGASERVLREVPFTFREEAVAYDPAVTDLSEAVVVQGIADCVFVENGGLVIVDYKTDRVKSPDELIGRYRAQLAMYARALSAVLELPVRECLLYSFALGQVIKI
ncbi:MAG: helicase-exonuclease AddAB subunit AddA [Clostridia bacterium]|nr:helicase-exonuclease AddAB subunit AddA [Clostridia bacterium]